MLRLSVGLKQSKKYKYRDVTVVLITSLNSEISCLSVLGFFLSSEEVCAACRNIMNVLKLTLCAISAL